MKDWAEINKNAIGDKWFKRITKEVKAHLKRETPTIPEVMGFALWCFNVVSTLGVLAGIAPNEVAIHSISKNLDERSTKRLLYLCAACLTLQYLR
jgi:hypothetical protein